MEKTIADTPTLDSEVCGEGNQHYFFDIKESKANGRFLKITRSQILGDKSIRRSQVVIFEDRLPFFIDSLAAILQRMDYDEMPQRRT